MCVFFRGFIFRFHGTPPCSYLKATIKDIYACCIYITHSGPRSHFQLIFQVWFLPRDLSKHTAVFTSVLGPVFSFFFCLFYPSLSSCVGSVNLVLDLCFCDSKLPFQHKGYNLQPGHVQFIPISAGPYWFMSMHKIFHLSYNIAVGCLVVVIKVNPITHVVDPT